MANKYFARVVCLLVAFVLAACGGGGGSSPPPPSPPPPTANAGAAQTVLAGADVALDGSASSDTGGAALTYSWTLTAKPAGSAAVLVAPTAAKPGFNADVAGTYTVSLTVSNGQQSSAAATVTVTAQPTDTLTIVTDQAEPLTGAVKLSLSGPISGAVVNWYSDLALVGTGPTATLNALNLANGSHQLIARVQVSATKTVDVRRTVNVLNPSVSTVTLTNRAVYGTGATILVSVTASSNFGVASVSATLDGAPLATLTSPNACFTDSDPGPGLPCSTPTLYQFRVLNAVSGDHTLLVTGTDNTGSSASLSIVVPVSNAPVIRLNSPADNLLVYGSLPLAGSATTDKPGAAVIVQASLGSVGFLNTRESTFSTSYDISGLAAGSYDLTVSANDGTAGSSVQRKVFVPSSSALAYPPIPGLSDGLAQWATDGAQMLYLKYGYGSEDLRLRDLSTSVDIGLEGSAGILSGGDFALQYWKVNAGRVYASGQPIPGDCNDSGSCVYSWGSDGKRVNLSNGSPWSVGRTHVRPVAHDGYVLWANESFFTLYNIASGTYTQVTPDSTDILAGSSALVANSATYDFVVSGPGVKVFYDQWLDNPKTSEVFRWDSDTGKSMRLSAAGQLSRGPQTDGARVAWLTGPAGGGVSGATSLMIQPISGGAASMVTSGATQFMLRDGALAWIDVVGTSRAVKALKGSDIVTLATGANVDLIAMGGGFAVYQALNGKIYSWNATTGQSNLLLDFKPVGNVTIVGNAVYFGLGYRASPGGNRSWSAAMYKVTLN